MSCWIRILPLIALLAMTSGGHCPPASADSHPEPEHYPSIALLDSGCANGATAMRRRRRLHPALYHLQQLHNTLDVLEEGEIVVDNADACNRRSTPECSRPASNRRIEAGL